MQHLSRHKRLSDATYSRWGCLWGTSHCVCSIRYRHSKMERIFCHFHKMSCRLHDKRNPRSNGWRKYSSHCPWYQTGVLCNLNRRHLIGCILAGIGYIAQVLVRESFQRDVENIGVGLLHRPVESHEYIEWVYIMEHLLYDNVTSAL